MATAQIGRAGATLVLAQIFVRGTDIAFNPSSQTALMVGAAAQSLTGICLNANGSPITSLFTIGDGTATGSYLHFPRVTAGPGGTFLVAWHEGPATPNNGVFVRLVSCTAPYNVTAPALASDYAHFGSFVESGPAVAYSSTSGVFLTVWKTAQSSIHGRFINQNGTPVGGVFWLTNVGGSRDPGVTWNASTNEFGVSYTGWDGSGAFAAFVRVTLAGTPVGRTTFAYSGGTFNSDVAYNAATGQYVMGWVGGGVSNYATFTAGGALVGSGLISTGFGGTDNFGLAFNSASGTFLAVGQDNFSLDVAGTELNSFGVPISATTVLTDGGGIPGGFAPGSFYPRAAGLSTPKWSVGYARRFAFLANQIITTTSVGGGPQTPPGGTPAPTPPPPRDGGGGGGGGGGGCVGLPPFPGATCVNGGWVPGGTSTPTPAPAPAPPPPTSGCAGNPPFAGATCVNGGWVPGSGSGCIGSAPFAGAVCVDGGWVPGGGSAPTPPPPAPAPPTSGCVGNPPFPGAACVNGGWVPGSSCIGSAPFPGAVCVGNGWVPGTSTPTPQPAPPTSGCAGSAPFPGAICVNGGWVPGSSCIGNAPFPGAVCVNGGWVPGGTSTPAPQPGPTSGCVGSAPFAGALCVNGGWVPGGNCVGNAPFPGAVCVAGGWMPAEVAGQGSAGSGGCVGPNPFAIGGVCINGGWIPSTMGGGSPLEPLKPIEQW